ncbi:hypothetical protein C0992_003188 [Termitomyces sp. T32_za158]|nr:hypothetical protein C0992_003188 [Termitomyces sp. T32_za158]
MVFLSAAASLSFALLISARNTTSKRGMAFSAAETPGDIINANQTKSQINWQYDWGSIAPEYLAVDGIEYIPMQWGSANIEGFADAVQKQGAKTILAFNEPDFDQESNIQPSEAASLWKKYLEPMKANGIRLGAPAVTSNGQQWLAQFVQACSDCSVDFIPLHWYGDGVEGFYNYLWQVHGTYPNISLWVTEYASTSSNATVLRDHQHVDTPPPTAASENNNSDPDSSHPHGEQVEAVPPVQEPPLPKVTRVTPPEKQEPNIRFKDAPAQAKRKGDWGEGGYRAPTEPSDRLRRNLPYKVCRCGSMAVGG